MTMSENDDLIVSEVNFGLAEIPSNNQKEEYIVSTFRYSTRFSNLLNVYNRRLIDFTTYLMKEIQ